MIKVSRQVNDAEALALASTCADLRVTQVANGTWGVHALLPSGLLSGNALSRTDSRDSLQNPVLKALGHL